MFDKSLFIIQNKTLYGILTEIKLFENFKINFDKDLESFLNRDIDLIDRKSLCILNYELDSDFDAKIKKIVIPVILLTYDKKISLRSNFYEIKIPFQINYFFQRIKKFH